MAAEEFEPTGDGYQERLRGCIEVAWRRKLLFLLTTICGTALTVVVVLALPQVYRSDATILIESPQVPENFVSSGVTSYVDQRIEAIRQRILTQGNLLEIVGKFGLYADAAVAPPSDIESRMLQAIDIESVSAAAAEKGRPASTVAVTVSFMHKDPQAARDVANELVTRFLNANTQTRSSSVSETKEFLTNETERLNARVEQMDAEIAAYRKKYNDLLPERADQYARRTEELEDALRQQDSSMRILEASRISVVSQLAAYKKTTVGNDVLVTELKDTRTQLRDARNKYTPAHPEVRRLERKLATLNASLSSPDSGGSQSQQNTAQEADPVYAQLQLQLNGVDSQVKLLNDQRAAVQRDIQKLRQLSSQIPAVANDLANLQRQREDTVSKFQQLTSKEMQAQLSEKLESGQMAERFTLIAPPTLPDKPVKPNRTLLAAAGSGLSVAFAAAFIVLAEFMDSGIRRKRQLRKYFGERIPIISVPYVANARDRVWLAIRGMSVALVVVGCVLAAGISLHMHYQTVDALWPKGAQQVETKATVEMP